MGRAFALGCASMGLVRRPQVIWKVGGAAKVVVRIRIRGGLGWAV